MEMYTVEFTRMIPTMLHRDGIETQRPRTETLGVKSLTPSLIFFVNDLDTTTDAI